MQRKEYLVSWMENILAEEEAVVLGEEADV